jgi:ribonuclease-3
MLAHPGLEAVVISTGADSHAQFAIAAMRRGLHVFVEKPLCTSLAEIAALREAAHETGKEIGLGHWAVLSRHVEDVCDGRGNLRILGSLLEAWIGALYKQEDQVGRGYQVCYEWLIALIERHVDFVQLITEDTNYKDQLLRHFQATYHQPPRYKEVEVVGPPHDRTFTMGVLDPEGKVIATSTARNKKVAEQEASRLALERLTGVGSSA